MSPESKAPLGVSVIIPHRPSDSVARTVLAVQTACRAHDIRHEIYSVCGNNPTEQRNRCIVRAVEPWIYFLDNDSVPDADTFAALLKILDQYPDAAVVGGPSLLLPTEEAVQQAAAAVFSSPLAVGKIAARYSRRGFARVTDDNELILCNLLVRRDVFDRVGLLDSRLYPNEENEFLARVVQAGLKVVYGPDVAIYREQRRTVAAFAKQVLTYGRGRGEQTRVSPSSFRPNLVIPLCFSLYMLGLPLVLAGFGWLAAHDALSSLGMALLMLTVLPLGLYTVLVLTFVVDCRRRLKRLNALMPFFYLLNHLLYGIGFVQGLAARRFVAQTREFSFSITKEA